MKNETTRTKTLSGFSYRAIALVLCFVMLLTAIGSGSVLSAIAADFEGNGAAVLVDAAKAGADVDAPASGEAEESSDILAPEDIDDGFVLTKKGDAYIADTGRDADIAKTGDWTGRSDWTYIHFVGDDLSGSGLDTNYFTSSSATNNFTGTWYIKNKNSDYANYEYNYYFKVHGKVKDHDDWNYYLSLNNAVFGTNITGSGEHNGTTRDIDTIDIYESNGNMTLKTMPTPTGWVKLEINFWGEYSQKTKLGLYQSAVPALVASDKTLTANGGDSINVMPSITGGTGNTNRSYTVRDQYGNTVSDCMSGDNFTAPYVTEETVYYIDSTVTDSNISTLVDTATVTVTVSPKVSDTYRVVGASGLTGVNWDISKNYMTQTANDSDKGTFVWKAENVSKGDYEFKIYDGSYHGWGDMDDAGNPVGTGNATLSDAGGDNHNIKLTLSADSNVTITFTNNNKGGVAWTITADATSSTEYTTTINDADTAHAYSTTIATASPASCYEGTRVTIATTPKTGYVARVSLTGGVTATKSGNNFYFNMPASDVTATVTYVEASAVPVTVYANSGGSVNVLYGSASFTITEGEHDTIKVNEGDSITLTAVPDSEHSFSKWYKNLENNYSPGVASITETIDSKKIYVASFGGASGSTGFNDSTYTTPGTNFSIKYSTGKNSEYAGASGTALTGTVYRSGDNDYYIELSSDELAAWKSASGQVRWNLFNNSDAQITDKSGYDVQYYDPATSALKNCESNGDNTLLIKSKPEDYGDSKFIELSNIDSSITSLGIHINTSTKKVDYYFGTSSGAGSAEYIPSTNYYAKDSSIREGGYNFWTYSPYTEVTAVAGEVSVDQDHTDTRKWVEGYALKGSQITVTSIIPELGRYKSVDRNGNTTTDKKPEECGSGETPGLRANEKYYVAGFSFNGVTPRMISESEGVAVTNHTFIKPDGTTTTANGTAYTCTYTIPTDMKETMLEITPILFIKDAYASETVMVYVNGYNDSVKNAGWGNTLFLYPFYQAYKKGNKVDGEEASYYGQAENFGRYPGQPIVNYGGQLFAQIPLTDDGSIKGKDGNGGPIKGITLNNGYYDDVHKNYCNHVSVHRQTYDYDDFAKIYFQKKTKNGSKYMYSIYFSFKYFAQDSSHQHRLANTTNNIDEDNDASRYNDLLASGNILNDTTGTVASSTLITAGENSTGWQDLEDSLGNDVDIFGNKVTKASAEPLRVFSLGYEYNNSGRWATEWVVYHKNGNNYELIFDSDNPMTGGAGGNDKNKQTNSSIVPSALIYNDKTSLAAATSMDGDRPISGFAGLYEELEEYRGIPVKICYEHDIPDAFKTAKNYRCDGRWTYTTVDDFVRSKIKIQYYDKNGVLHDDTYADDASIVGETTGCSAYFTNSEYYGKRVSNSELIDNSKSYTFTAENVGSYEFVGWYMYDTAGHESTITTESKTAETPRSGNFVLAARYKYIASGNLTISNTLKGNSVGRGTTYLGVSVKNGDKVTPIANVNSNTSSVTLDKTYINANSNYQIIVDIRTVPTGENTFMEYTAYTTNGSTGTDDRSAASDTDIYDPANKTHKTDTYTINVKGDIFDETTTNQQNVKAIEYVSELNPVTYAYSIKYNYTSREYGDQAFTREGTLTSGQINDKKVVTGTLNKTDYPDKKLTKEFLAKIAPHESNFNTEISWNFDSAVINNQTCTYDSLTNTFSISLEIANDKQTTSSNVARHGYFTVPYNVGKTDEKNGIAIGEEGTGKVSKAEAAQTFTIDLDYDQLFKAGDNNLVIAPKVIYETVDGVEKARYFKYWTFSTASSARGDSREVGRCYYPEFNYRALDNYNITAVYTTKDDERIDPNNASSAVIGENSFGDLYKENSLTTISFIGNSRNQWNKDDNGTHTYYAGDLVYNDFILTFKPEGQDLIKDLNQDVKCGFVIQRLKEIETNASGTNAKTLQEYAKDYSAADLLSAQSAAKAKAGGSNTTGYTQFNVSIDKTNINDKNRCHYAYAMWNTNQRTNGGAVYPAANAKSNTKYLYRAYSYMKIGDGDYIMSDAPTYFYMYDIANS
jgi:hypothetical protein